MARRASSWLAGVVERAFADPATRPSTDGAEIVLADTVGAIAGGSRVAQMVCVADRLVAPVGRARPDASPFGPDGASLIGPDAHRGAPDVAAFVNAMAGCWLEMDEGIRPTGHPGIHVAAAALAVAQAAHASGARLLAAFAGGYEVAAALFTAFVPVREVHPHGTFGAIGAAAAAADLIGVDPAAAAALAASTPLAPMWSACLEGATIRNAYAAHAASLGVRSALLAGAGVSASPAAFDDAFGSLLGRFPRSRLADAGKEPCAPAFRRNYFKLHSACVLVHSAIDATLEAGPVRDRDIRSVTVSVPSRVLRVRGMPARNELSIRFSLPYAVAVALAHGRADERDMALDARCLRLARRVTVRHERAFDARWPAESPARVVVRTAADDRTALVANHRGHHLRPPSPEELRSKFERLTAGTVAEGRYDALLGLRALEDVAALF
jgi:2-methylcitrate dehydratase PrpD